MKRLQQNKIDLIREKRRKYLLYASTHAAKNLPWQLRRSYARISRGSPNTSHFLPAECRRSVKCPKRILPTYLRGTSSWEFRRNSKGRPNRNFQGHKHPRTFPHHQPSEIQRKSSGEFSRLRISHSFPQSLSHTHRDTNR